MVPSAKGNDEETIEMLYFKACPKCLTGTIEHNGDSFTEYVQCLNCGLMRDIPDEMDVFSTLKELHAQFKAQRAAEEAAEAEEARAIA